MGGLSDDIANKAKIVVIEEKGTRGGCLLSSLLTGGIFGIVCAATGAVLLNLKSLYSIDASSQSFVIIVSVLFVIISLHYLLLFYKEWNVVQKHILEGRRIIIEKSLECMFMNTRKDEKKIMAMNLVIAREQVEPSVNETGVEKCGNVYSVSTYSTDSMPMSSNMN